MKIIINLKKGKVLNARFETTQGVRGLYLPGSISSAQFSVLSSNWVKAGLETRAGKVWPRVAVTTDIS